jgi:hypothetical protein
VDNFTQAGPTRPFGSVRVGRDVLRASRRDHSQAGKRCDLTPAGSGSHPQRPSPVLPPDRLGTCQGREGIYPGDLTRTLMTHCWRCEKGSVEGKLQSERRRPAAAHRSRLRRRRWERQRHPVHHFLRAGRWPGPSLRRERHRQRQLQKGQWSGRRGAQRQRRRPRRRGRPGRVSKPHPICRFCQARARSGQRREAQSQSLIERPTRRLTRLERLAHDLHVLPRHRPPSISPERTSRKGRQHLPRRGLHDQRRDRDARPGVRAPVVKAER